MSNKLVLSFLILTVYLPGRILGHAGNLDLNGGVSGSATSTGSFGELHISDRIGVGTTAPTEKLTVAGDISASGDFHLDGQAGFGSAPNTNYAATFQQPTGTNKDF